MIGIDCEMEVIPDNILGMLLENIDLEKYTWDLTYAELSILFPESPYLYFQNNGLQKFIKACEKEQIPDLVLKGYSSPEFTDVMTNKEFINSNCVLVLIICDVKYLEIYFKKELSKIILNNLDKMHIKYEIKTLENDARTRLSI